MSAQVFLFISIFANFKKILYQKRSNQLLLLYYGVAADHTRETPITATLFEARIIKVKIQLRDSKLSLKLFIYFVTETKSFENP